MPTSDRNDDGDGATGNTSLRPEEGGGNGGSGEKMWSKTWDHFGQWLKAEDQMKRPTTVEAGAVDGQAPVDRQAKFDEREATHVDKRVSPEDFEKKDSQQKKPTRPSHAVIPGLPRTITFTRKESERREHLFPYEPEHDERRATSVERKFRADQAVGLQQSTATESASQPSKGETEIPPTIAHSAINTKERGAYGFDLSGEDVQESHETAAILEPPSHEPDRYPDQVRSLDPHQLQRELESKWILNLSMHFRDHSPREKFFVTYISSPVYWRRITISLDYRQCLPDSLEAELQPLRSQRDKSARIYEAIHDSLDEIQFYPSVTNLKLETRDGRLHVHVTEDLNEIIAYPLLVNVPNLSLPIYEESSLTFNAHLSGFEYTVDHGPRTLVRKEISSADAVDEFLYELHALAALRASPNVIDLEGIVVDSQDRIKGLLLESCPLGALADIMYTYRPALPLRLRWAHQLLQGLADIHDAGFVHGDLTLSNVVVDGKDNIKIIDVNRRGCPIGWEPPEFLQIMSRKGRVDMFVGIKSDLWMAGMCIWGLAVGCDEPERMGRPLKFQEHDDAPEWLTRVVEICLSEDPKGRRLPKELLALFPEDSGIAGLADSERLIDSSIEGVEYLMAGSLIGLEEIAPRDRETQRGRGLTISSTSEAFADVATSSASEFCIIDDKEADLPTPTLARNDIATPAPERHTSIPSISAPKETAETRLPADHGPIRDVPSSTLTPAPPKDPSPPPPPAEPSQKAPSGISP